VKRLGERIKLYRRESLSRKVDCGQGQLLQYYRAHWRVVLKDMEELALFRCQVIHSALLLAPFIYLNLRRKLMSFILRAY